MSMSRFLYKFARASCPLLENQFHRQQRNGVLLSRQVLLIGCRQAHDDKKIRHVKPFYSSRGNKHSNELMNSRKSLYRSTQEDEDMEKRLFEKKEKGTKERREPVLANSLTPEMQEDLISSFPNGKFLLPQVLSDILYWEVRHSWVKLPSRLSLDQWKTLFEFNNSLTRHMCIKYFVHGSPSLDEIKELDNKYSEPLNISEELVAKVIGDDKDAQYNLKMFLMCHELRRQSGDTVPHNISVRELKGIVKITSKSQRHKYIDMLVSEEWKRFWKSVKKKEKEIELNRIRSCEREEDDDKIHYRLFSNSIYLRQERRTTSNFYNWKTLREFNDWGIPLVIDLSYSSDYKLHKNRERSFLFELSEAIRINREAETPFQLHMTGINDSVQRKLAHIWKNKEPCNITKESHLDMFPRDRLVYLSPDSRNDLIQFNPNDIYVIGGLLDVGNERSPYTLSKAKKLKIRHARLPMRRVLGLTADLNIEACVAILNDLKKSNDWFYSLRWVPPRFVLQRAEMLDNPAEKLKFRAHRQLHPSSPTVDQCIRNRALNARKYREYYKKIMLCESEEQMHAVLEELKI